MGCHRQRSYHAVGVATLFNVGTLLPNKECVDSSGYTTYVSGYTCVFAGESAPNIDNSFTPITNEHLPMTIHQKTCVATDDDSYIPLSVGIFESRFHGFQVRSVHLRIIENAVGKSKGLFTSRPRSDHHG